MFYTVAFFGLLGRVPRFEAAGKVAGDATHTHNIFALAYGAVAVYNALVTTVATSVDGVVDRAVAYAFILHHLDNLEYDYHVLLGLAVQFDVCNVSTSCDSVEGGFFLYLIDDADRLFYVDVE